MNSKDEAIAEALTALAEYYGTKITPLAIEVATENLRDLNFGILMTTLKEWPKLNMYFPKVSEIRAKILPELEAKDDAQEVANRIVSSISSCGYTNPDKAKLRIGTLGWEVVERMGGWTHLCKTVDHDNEGMFRAQIRSYAESVAKRAKRGMLDEAPALPSPSNGVDATSVSTDVKKLISVTMGAKE